MGRRAWLGTCRCTGARGPRRLPARTRIRPLCRKQSRAQRSSTVQRPGACPAWEPRPAPARATTMLENNAALLAERQWGRIPVSVHWKTQPPVPEDSRCKRLRGRQPAGTSTQRALHDDRAAVGIQAPLLPAVQGSRRQGSEMYETTHAIADNSAVEMSTCVNS